MQPNRGRYNRRLLGLREDRSRVRGFRLLFSDRKNQASVEPQPKSLPGAHPEVNLDLLTPFAGLSLDKSDSDFELDLAVAHILGATIHPPAAQHPQQEPNKQQYQHLNSRQTPGSKMDESENAFQETAALMANMASISDETKSQCRISVLELFCDMDPDHLSFICEQCRWIPEHVISQVVNDMEDGNSYPKIQRSSLKRKRQDEEDATSPENAAKKWDNIGRRSQLRDAKSSYTRMSHSILQQFFPQMYVENLKSFMTLNGGILYPTYLLLSKATAEGDEANPLFRKKRGRAPKNPPFLAGILDERIRDCLDDGEREALEEVRAARIAEQVQAAEAQEARRKEQLELENFETARAEGTLADCGCCFVEYAINRMVHCDGEEVHFFCRDCARTMAETQIGMAKHNLDCMSTDGCTGGFARSQREIFLDAKSRTALEQIEMDASIRASGIDNIETCPFCPFAAEYPDLEVDREFRCLHKDCGIVSCRACRKETHIPKTCEEAALEQGHSARHGIEEAMSEALIRKCNNCATPFIKEHGCNKMTCTKCANVQCYVCSKSCDYSHFNDARRGGKVGNCDLFDKEGGVEARHQAEVKAAEEEARKKAREEHKDLNPELLEFKESEKVKRDEAHKRELMGRNRENRVNFIPMRPNHLHLHQELARRVDRLNALARAAPGAMAPRRAEPVPPLRIPPPPAAPARVAPFHNPTPPPPLPVPARGARQEPAMDPAFIWGRDAQAGRVQNPAPVAAVPAQVPGPAPAPQPQVGYGMGHMMQFMPFGNGVLNQAVDHALAQFGPAIRRSMPPLNDFDCQRPEDVANQNPHRPARVAPEIRPINLLGDPFLRAQNMNHFGPPFPQFREQIPLAEPLQPKSADPVIPDRPGAQNRPDPVSPPPEQARGNRDDPIILSSPSRPDLIDLTIDEGDYEAARKLWGFEDGPLWPNLLDVERQWSIDRDGVDPF